jgi:hypothetical protein
MCAPRSCPTRDASRFWCDHHFQHQKKQRYAAEDAEELPDTHARQQWRATQSKQKQDHGGKEYRPSAPSVAYSNRLPAPTKQKSQMSETGSTTTKKRDET